MKTRALIGKESGLTPEMGIFRANILENLEYTDFPEPYKNGYLPVIVEEQILLA